jgi:hypothetical protein
MRFRASKWRSAGVWPVVLGAADVGLGLLHHRVGQPLQALSRPHGVDLHLRRALDIVETVVGVGDGFAHRCDAVVGHEQDGLVADHLGQPLALLGLEGGAGVLVVVGDLAHHADLGLADLLDARVLQPGERAGERHVRVEYGGRRLRQHLVDRRMDAIAGALDVAGAALDLAVVDADLHEGRGLHLRPVQAERDLVVAVGLAGDDEGEVVEDALVEPVLDGHAVGGGQIDAGLPLGGAAVLAGDGGDFELHLHSSSTGALSGAKLVGTSLAIAVGDAKPSGGGGEGSLPRRIR